MLKIGLLWFLISLLISYNLYDNFDESSLKDKNVVITGGSTGIGEQIAYHYAKMGARILITSRTESKLKKVVEGCYRVGSSNGVYLYHVADMTKLESTPDIIQTAKEKLGGVDILVLNHILIARGGEWLGTQENLTLLHQTIQVNYLSYVHLISHAMPLLERRHGSVIVMSSVSGKFAQPYFGPYTSSKFALNGFFASLRQEFEIRNINISITICTIGLVDTDNAVMILHELGATRILQSVTRAKSEDVAYAVIKAGAEKIRDFYYPYLSSRIITIFNCVSPKWAEMVNKYLYAQ